MTLFVATFSERQWLATGTIMLGEGLGLHRLSSWYDLSMAAEAGLSWRLQIYHAAAHVRRENSSSNESASETILWRATALGSPKIMQSSWRGCGAAAFKSASGVWRIGGVAAGSWLSK